MAGPNFGDLSGVNFPAAAGASDFGNLDFPDVPDVRKKGGGSIFSGGPLGWALHEAGQFGKDVVAIGEQSLLGIPDLTKSFLTNPPGTLGAIATSIVGDLRHPLRHPGYTASDIIGLYGGGGAIVGRAAELGRVARGASELAKADELGVPTVTPGRQARQALTFGLSPKQRLIVDPGRAGGDPYVQKGMYYSRNAGIRGAQQLLDQLHETYPDLRIPGVFARQSKRVQRASMASTTFEKGLGRAPAAILVKKYGKLTDAEHEAVAMVGRGVLPETQVAFIEGTIPFLKGHELARATAWLDRTKTAEMYLEPRDVSTMPTFEEVTHKDGTTEMVQTHPGGSYQVPQVKPEHSKLARYVEDARTLSNLRTHAVEAAGFLSHESETRRALGPRSVMEGRELMPDLAKIQGQISFHEKVNNTAEVARLRNELAYWTDDHQQLSLTGEAFGEDRRPKALSDPELARELFRVPETLSTRQVVDQFMRPWRGGNVPLPSSLTHAYEGVMLRHGGGDTNTARLIAESYTEAARFLYLTKLRETVLASARDTPEGIPKDFALPIVTEFWEGRLGPGWNFAMKALDEGVQDPAAAEAAGRWYEPIRQKLMTAQSALDWINDQVRNQVGGDESSALRWARQHGAHFDKQEDLYTHLIPGVKWIDKRILGGLDKQSPLWSAMENPAVLKTLKGVDILNEVQKDMILYLKPAYAVPNMLGNVALALVQQGFLMPLNLGKTLQVMFKGKGLDAETVETIKAVMGGGLSESLRTPTSKRTPHGLVMRTSNAVAGGYGKFIDDPFRFSSFLHEARAQGYTTAAEIKKLTSDPALEDTLREVSIRANDALINYERLGPGEQAILRRLVFFYPWVKGSTRYGYQLSINHPVTVGILGQAGERGEKISEERLGQLPVYLEGVIPYGEDKVINPQSASILGEPASLVKNVINTISRDPNPDLSILENLAPVDAALYALATGHSTVPHPTSQSHVITALNSLVGGNALQILIKNLTTNPRENQIYQDNSLITDLLRFGVTGGLTPREFNKLKANYIAFLEQHQHGYTH